MKWSETKSKSINRRFRCPYITAGVKKYRVPKIERPTTHRTLCQIVLYAPMLFLKVTLYSVDVYGKRTLSYGGPLMFLHRVILNIILYSYNTNNHSFTHHHSTNSYEPIRFLQTSQNRLINIHRKSLKHISQSALFGFGKNIGHDQIWYENSVVFKAVQWLSMIKDRRPC